MRGAVLVVLLSLVVSGSFCTDAFANFTRPYLPPPLSETPSGHFEKPVGVTVDSMDDVWVSDPAKNHVTEFDSAGVAQPEYLDSSHFPSGAAEISAIANASDRVYVTGNSDGSGVRYVSVFKLSTGEFVEEWGPFFGRVSIAVDASTVENDVYVDESGYHVVKRFDASGHPVNFCSISGNTTGNELTGAMVAGEWAAFSVEPWSMSTDAQGNLYVVIRGFGPGSVDKFNPCGELVGTFDLPGAGFDTIGISGVAVDPTNGDVVVGESGGGVYEFKADGEYLGAIFASDGEYLGPDDPPVAALLGEGRLAINSQGELFIADPNRAVVDKLGLGEFVPSEALVPSTDLEEKGITLNGTVNPEGLSTKMCKFEYVTAVSFAKMGFEGASTAQCEAPDASEIGVDHNEHAVHAKLVGLVSGEAYRYRLTVLSEGGGSSHSIPAGFTTMHIPVISGSTVGDISATSVKLHAEINPLGADTRYQFEYVVAAQYAPQASNPYAAGGVAPVSPQGIGSGGSSVAVLQDLEGLEAGTAYDFRVVALNAVGMTAGPNETFTTLSAAPPAPGEERGYEMLTPSSKGGAEDMFGAPGQANFDFGYATSTGDGFLLLSSAAFGPSAISGQNGYLFQRGQAGWAYRAIAPTAAGPQSLGTVVPDAAHFARVAFHDTLGTGAKPSTREEADEAGPSGGPYQEIYRGSYTGGYNNVVGGSASLEDIVLSTRCLAEERAACFPNQGSDTYGLVKQDAVGDESRIDVDSEGAPIGRCGAVLGMEDGVAGGGHDAVSGDGSKIFFTAPQPYPYSTGIGCWRGPGPEESRNPPEIYMRVGDTKTVEVSVPSKGFTPARGLQAAVYVGAAVDGSKVFFMSESELTKDGEGFHDPELYEYDTDNETLTRVSRGESGRSEGDVSFVPAISADGSAVYFAAFDKLTSDAPATGGGTVDLYRYATANGKTSYIATISGTDYPVGVLAHWWEMPAQEVALDPTASWYATPDGRYLLFASQSNLTGYSTAAGNFADCPGVSGHSSDGLCSEIYRYDSENGELICVSCDPSGAAPVSNALFARSGVRADTSGGPPRAMSDDGSYIFFDTADPLVPQDTNGQLDVYQWHSGVVTLISSGTDPSDSFFLDASSNGSDVFFGTHARLVRSDTDSEGDLYDARIGAHVAGEGGTGACEGDACQTPPQAPSDLTPTSLAFSSPINAPVVSGPSEGHRSGRARKLAAALRSCRRTAHAHRTGCEARARKRYGLRSRLGHAKRPKHRVGKSSTGRSR